MTQHLTLTLAEQREAAAGKLATCWRKMRRQPSGYPDFVAEKTTSGYTLCATARQHRGSGIGHVYAPTLHLYGAANCEVNGGLAWQKGELSEHEEYKCPLTVEELVQLKSRMYRNEQHELGRPLLVSAIPTLRDGAWGWLYTFDWTQAAAKAGE